MLVPLPKPALQQRTFSEPLGRSANPSFAHGLNGHQFDFRLSLALREVTIGRRMRGANWVRCLTAS